MAITHVPKHIEHTLRTMTQPEFVRMAIKVWKQEDDDYNQFVKRYGTRGSFTDYLEFTGQEVKIN